MSATMIAFASVNPAEAEAAQAYSGGTQPLIKEAGGKPIGRFKFREALVGADFPQTVLAMEFPDAEAIKGFLESDDYKALLPLRDKAFQRFQLFICDVV